MPFALVESPAGSGTSALRRRATGSGHGDLAYVTMEVVGPTRARGFYGSVLGWQFRPGHSEGGWDVEDVALSG